MGEKDRTRCEETTLGATGVYGLAAGLGAMAVSLGPWLVFGLTVLGGISGGAMAHGSADSCSEAGAGGTGGGGTGGGGGAGGGQRLVLPLAGGLATAGLSLLLTNRGRGDEARKLRKFGSILLGSGLSQIVTFIMFRDVNGAPILTPWRR
jgi:hypothetical protein